jgi:hypothetical protein
MESEQQGLYLLTVVCSLVSLFSICLFLVICGLTKMWKISSIRLVVYLNCSNMLSGFVLILPTFKYEFMCSFQGHLLNFAIVSQVIWPALLMHFAYYKIVQELNFNRVVEVRYIGIALLPALITSMPPFVSENLGNNCWKDENSPLKDAVANYGFLIVAMISFLVSVSFALGIFVHLDLFPKGYLTQEYEKKEEKIRFLGKFPAFYYLSGSILFFYSVLELVDRQRRSVDFIAMFCHTLSGFMISLLCLTSLKCRTQLSKYLKPVNSRVHIMKEDFERLSSATEELSHDLSD